jgi:hypothetical protein
MSLNSLVKRIVKDYLYSAQLADTAYGTVKSSNPLEVTVDQRFTLPVDFLVVPEHMTAYSITVGGQKFEIRRGLEAGDRVVLVRSSGGGKYVIVGRLTE